MQKLTVLSILYSSYLRRCGGVLCCVLVWFCFLVFGFFKWDILGIYKHRGKENVGQEDNQQMGYQEHMAPD